MSEAGRGRGPSWFVAFPFAHGAALDDLPPPPARGLRLFAVEDLHVTLAFLGPCGEERAHAAFASVDAGAMAPVEVLLGGARLLGHPRRPTAVARVLVSRADALAAYIGAHRDLALLAAGAPLDDREPLPHLTLARIHRRASYEERALARAWLEAIPAARDALPITEIALYTRAEDGSGRQYRIVARRPLGRAG